MFELNEVSPRRWLTSPRTRGGGGGSAEIVFGVISSNGAEMQVSSSFLDVESVRDAFPGRLIFGRESKENRPATVPASEKGLGDFVIFGPEIHPYFRA